jgi:hypothetical protein
VQVVNEGGVVHRVLQPVEAPAGWAMFDRVALTAAAMPMARMSAGGLPSAGPVAGRFATPRGSGGLLGSADRPLGAPRGRAGPGRSPRRRSGGFASDPLAGTDLAPYRRRAAQLAILLEGDRSLPKLAPRPAPGLGPRPAPGLGREPVPGLGREPVPGLGPEPGPARGDLERRLGLVRVGVEALVADLESVDAVEEEVRPLRELAAELARVPSPWGAGRVGVAGVAAPEGFGPVGLERVRERALAVLWAFARPEAPGGPDIPGAPGTPERIPEAPGGPGGGEATPPGRDSTFWKR